MAELIEKLGIDWRLLIAQIVNFSILALVLTKLLYKPLLKMLDERRASARTTVEGAEELANAKRELSAETEAERLHARKEADAILVEARKRADILRAEAVAQLEQELIALKNKTTAELENERTRAMSQIKNDIAALALSAAEKVLEREVKDKDSMRLAQEAVEIMRTK